jgi:hypothetical protein
LPPEGNAFREVYFGSQVIRIQAQFLAERGDGFIEINAAPKARKRLVRSLAKSVQRWTVQKGNWFKPVS